MRESSSLKGEEHKERTEWTKVKHEYDKKKEYE